MTTDGVPFYGETAFSVGELTVEPELPLVEVNSDIPMLSDEPILKAIAHKDGEKLIRKAMRFCRSQMDKSWINSAFFREKFYQDNYLVSLEEWQLKSKLSSAVYKNDDLSIFMEKGKKYTTFDFREVIKVLPNHRDAEYIYSADPLFVRKSFLDWDFLDYYQYSIVGETKVDTVTCYEVLFDVRKEAFISGFRGRLLIGKYQPFIYEANYSVSPTNRDFLDPSFFVHDCAEAYDLELEATSYKATYHCEEKCFYPTSLHEKITFNINHKRTQVFERELLTYGVSKDDKIRSRTQAETAAKTYLVKNPLYDQAMFEGIQTIELPQADLDEMPYLHEITRYR